MNLPLSSLCWFFRILPLALLAVGCVSHEQLVNFNQGAPFPSGPEPLPALAEPLIQPYDALTISVQALDPLAAAPFNLSAGVADATQGAGTNATANSASGANHQVDAAGYIELPLIGPVRLGGLSVAQARDTLQLRLAPYLREPFVSIRRYSQFRFTVLGEVKAPATLTVPEDRLTILQAIGLAGDLSTYGDRENILVIREHLGQRQYGYLNLRDRAVFQSPYFYLQRNDVVYVQPLKQKAATVADQTAKIAPFLGLGIGILNLVVIIITRN